MQQSLTYRIRTSQRTDQKCSKSLPAPTQNLNDNQLDEIEHRSDNRRLAQWRVTWLFEHSTSHCKLPRKEYILKVDKMFNFKMNQYEKEHF